MQVNIYNSAAEEVGKLKLNKTVFGAEYNEPLIHQVIVAQQNNKRQGSKSTLTRAEVRGGGIKPWRQKGTGRARQGSIRSPQWKGGGVVFAPKPRDFSQKVNKEMKRAAMRSALSAKASANEIIVLEDLKFKGKTKEAAELLKNFKIDEARVLFVTDSSNAMNTRAVSNIENVKIVNADLINVYDSVVAAKIVATKAAIEKIEEALKD